MSALSALRVFQHQHLNIVEAPTRQLNKPASGFTVYGVCDQVVGDFCFTGGDGGIRVGGFGTQRASLLYSTSFIPRVYRRESARMLDRYVAALRDARKIIPGDNWISGELVRIALERGTADRAMDEAERCRAEAWWCSMLRGHVMHSGGDWLSADSTFSVALAQMPYQQRCIWLDPTSVVREGAFRREWRERDCIGQIDLANRLWWLADPLFMVRGNERRSEHFSRTVALILMDWYQRRVITTASALAHGSRWSILKTQPVDFAAGILTATGSYGEPFPEALITDPTERSGGLLWLRAGLPELVMRTGIPQFFAEEDPGEGFGARLIGQHAERRYSFVPSANAVLGLKTAKRDDWDLSVRHAYEFFPNWQREMLPLEHQVAYFRRGDSARVIAASRIPLGMAFNSRGMVSGLFLQDDHDAPVVSTRGSGTSTSRFSLFAPHDSSLVAIEMRATGEAAARTRFADGPPPMPAQRTTLSSLMLVAPMAEPTADLDAVFPLVIGTNRLERNTRIGLYWEMYGLQMGERPTISVSVRRLADPVFAELFRTLTLQGGRDSLIVEWEEPPVAGRVVESRNINLALGDLSRGRYMMAVEIRLPGQLPVFSMREVEVW